MMIKCSQYMRKNYIGRRPTIKTAYFSNIPHDQSKSTASSEKMTPP